MVKTCCAYNCRNRANSSAKANNISFFRFPANRRKLQAWVKSINRLDWEPNNHTHICSEHFVFGWHSDDPNDVNYAPTLFTHKEKRKMKLKDAQKGSETNSNWEQNLVTDINVRDSESNTNQYSRLSNNSDASTETHQRVSEQSIYVFTENYDHLKDHQYCKQLPWPGKRMTKPKSSKDKLSRESAAETLLTLCAAPVHLSHSNNSLMDTANIGLTLPVDSERISQNNNPLVDTANMGLPVDTKSVSQSNNPLVNTGNLGFPVDSESNSQRIHSLVDTANIGLPVDFKLSHNFV